MSSNLITIVAAGDFRAAQPNQVLIEAGSTITFTGPAHSKTVLLLTAPTAALLSPTPPSLTVEIAAGHSVTFTFGKPADLAYCCQLAATAAAHTVTCPPSEEGAVLTILASDRDLPPPVIQSAGTD